MKSVLLASAVLFAALPAFAQEVATEATADDGLMQGDIIVTATKRSQALSDVPIAISAVTAESLQNSGASDIRQLNQLSPSLLVSSSSSETSGGAARIRGIGTVGDNAGLEASVAVFVDGVYRSRTGAGLTELGEIERIEVLRGPQGTLFGRNASAGLINVVTAKPKFEVGGTAEVTYGNYDYWRLAGGFTGGIIDNILAARVDGVYVKRDGFITDVISGDKMNDRDRWMLRGQLLFTPNDDIEFRLIGDYSKREESCCAGTFQPFRTVTFNQATQSTSISPNNSIVNILRGLGGVISDDTYGRKTAITPGRNYDNDVKDWGISGELNWDLGFGGLTSITAWRDWKTLRNQDADFTSLDILQITGNETRFRTFSQELRLNGTLFDDRLDWLVGGYYANETLDYTSHTRYGADYTRYANCLVANSLNASVPGLLSPTSNGCLNPTLAAAIVSNPNLPAALRTPVAIFGGFAVPGVYGYDAVAAIVGQPGKTLSNTGIVEDRYKQSSTNYAFFTHNVFEIVPDKLSLTLGARYTNETKKLTANLDSDNTLCAAIAASALASLATAPCVISSFDFAGTSRRSEDQWTGTVVLSYKPFENLMTYASYAKGYKSGGFNMDRSSLNAANVQMTDLQFGAETVDSFEVGAKFDTRGFTLNIAAFRSVFDQFQLNAFNGVNFVVDNIQACSKDLNGGDRDFAGLPVNGVPLTQAQAAASGRCDAEDVKAGVTSTGLEIEAAVYPAPNLMFNLGMTYADTRYRNNLTGVGGKPLGTAFFNLPGNQLSNAPEYVMTGAVTFTPPVTDTLSALFYLDYRFQSGINTGSDLYPEKYQEAVMVVNGRIGLSGPDRKWSVEAWAQNLLDTDYQQVGFNAPLLGSGTIAQTARGGPAANQLFGAFLAEPRTFGVTVRTKF
ncbi:TonB-dependent receptor [Sandaracinobacteroides hominis]|uniref:TonB-dependent receptor n=1 Tax=Sandaracinobacteroides hominis TaxID=2780086 RepID=UPI0018F33842|nr:TonB-dependent receptor [Sandaracinobacteroides hominis]